jgi:probable F420-dependent oxidoreductase
VTRPFRFAVIARWAGGGTRWHDFARRAEGLGYDTLLITDHMGPQLAPVPAMMAAADATTRLRVGSFVFANDYRNPVMLAKEIATVDALSAGRVEWGLGAGWAAPDYKQLGIPYDAPAVRVSRFEEAVRLIKRLLSEESVDHRGTYYTVSGARILPRPSQRPYPPLMIGGGAPRVLRIAAREADIVSFVPGFNARGRPRVDMLRMNTLVPRLERLHAERGDRQLDINVWLMDAAVTDRPRSRIAAITSRLRWGANAMFNSPYFLYGSRSSLRDLLRERRERYGLNYISIPGAALDAFAPVIADLR